MTFERLELSEVQVPYMQIHGFLHGVELKICHQVLCLEHKIFSKEKQPKHFERIFFVLEQVSK